MGRGYTSPSLARKPELTQPLRAAVGGDNNWDQRQITFTYSTGGGRPVLVPPPPIAPPPPPPPVVVDNGIADMLGTRIDQQACSLADFEGRIATVDRACCDANDPSDDCEAGSAPTACDFECSEVWLPVWADCGALLQVRGSAWIKLICLACAPLH